MWLQIDLCISSEFVQRFHNSTLTCNVKMQYLIKQHMLENLQKVPLFHKNYEWFQVT